VIDSDLIAEVQAWIALDPDPKTASLLQGWLDSGNEVELRKSFNGFLEFGTAGLRGPVRPGPSGMNRAVVGRTAAGIAKYLTSRGLNSVVIGRDARHGSAEFMQESAEIFAGAGLEVHLLPRHLPTPLLAYAVIKLGVDCGVMVTASHNPAADNGYKVYLGGNVDGISYRGSQIISPTDANIAVEISKINNEQPRGSTWEIVPEAVITSYLNETAAIVKSPRDIKVIYTAMHGVGTESIQALFLKSGYQQPILVSAQCEPDPDFPTVAFPNPEEPGAIDLALETAINHGADLVIANDPDADRCAIAAHDPIAGWRMLRGDEVGIILGYYIATKRSELIKNGTYGNSIVSSSALKKIATKYGIEFSETLTGFKWLAKIPNLAFGYEEAIGYCVDSKTVNDKDGLSAALMLTECAAALKYAGSNLFEYLDEIWNEIGIHRTEAISIRVANISQTEEILKKIRISPPDEIAGLRVEQIDDLLHPDADLLPTNGLRLWLADGAGKTRIIIRPSGTEPKLKCYIEVVRASGSQSDKAAADEMVLKLKNELGALLV
jgi:phosphomannomutase